LVKDIRAERLGDEDATLMGYNASLEEVVVCAMRRASPHSASR
jgi:hypothetical protein